MTPDKEEEIAASVKRLKTELAKLRKLTGGKMEYFLQVRMPDYADVFHSVQTYEFIDALALESITLSSKLTEHRLHVRQQLNAQAIFYLRGKKNVYACINSYRPAEDAMPYYTVVNTLTYEVLRVSHEQVLRRKYEFIFPTHPLNLQCNE